MEVATNSTVTDKSEETELNQLCFLFPRLLLGETINVSSGAAEQKKKTFFMKVNRAYVACAYILQGTDTTDAET